MTESGNCYDTPEYWDLAFSDDTSLEADFILAAAKKYATPDQCLTGYEPGCGGGRLLKELASRGLHVVGTDQSSLAVGFANQQLAELPGRAIVADMTTHVVERPVDVAWCLVNTFRHLLNDNDALSHLKAVANSVRPGGIYVIGLHLFPPDADEEDEEEWPFSNDQIDGLMQLEVADCRRDTRLETLRFTMTVTDRETQQTKQFTSDYRMRLYEATHIQSLLSAATDWELLDVYDFWYDLSEPLELTDELGDTVLVLRRL